MGRWPQRLVDFYGLKARLLAEEFVNWGDKPADIVRFIKVYAPLYVRASAGESRPGTTPGDRPVRVPPRPGAEFHFSIPAWRAAQASFRRTWNIIGGFRTEFVLHLEGLDSLTAAGGRVMYKASSLYNFMLMELLLAPHERLRKCRYPECPHPYFLARHLRQTYCSDLCAKWAQSQWKKKWWERRGKEWLENRKKRSIRRSRR